MAKNYYCDWQPHPLLEAIECCKVIDDRSPLLFSIIKDESKSRFDAIYELYDGTDIYRSDNLTRIFQHIEDICTS